MKVKEERDKLLAVFLFQLRTAVFQQPVQIFRADGGHLDDHKPGGQGLVQLPGAGVAVVHGGDEAGGGGHEEAVIPRDVQHPPEVQNGVEDGQCLVLRHVDLVQNAEAPVLGTLVNRPGPETDLPLREGVRPHQTGGVQIHMEGHVPGGAAKDCGQVFRQHVLASGLSPGEEQILSAEQRGDGLLPALPPVVVKLGDGDPLRQLCGIVCPELSQLLQQFGADPLLF